MGVGDVWNGKWEGNGNGKGNDIWIYVVGIVTVGI